MSCQCGDPVKAKGLCNKHYLADYRKRKEQGLIKKTSLTVLTDATYTDGPVCGVPNCGKSKRALSLCTKHYFQLRRAS